MPRSQSRILWCVALASAVCALAPAAHAETTQQCIDANDKALSLRKEGKLHDALGQLSACASSTCPADVRQECERRIGEIKVLMPTLVLSAKDGGGKDLTAVTVTLDGRPLTDRLTGVGIAVDPGPHLFTFEYEGTKLDQWILVEEGRKDRSVAVTLGKPVPPPSSAPPAPSLPNDSPEAATASSGPWKTMGWVAAGAGVVGVGIGAVFGLMATSSKSSANCDANNFCDAGPLSDARSQATVSTVGFVAGGALLAGGVAMVLLSPRGGETTKTGLRAEPMVSANGGGLALQGVW